MAGVVIQQTWPDGSVLMVQVSDSHPAYPDELAQLGSEARRLWHELTDAETDDDA